jgi:LysM repeat protein
MIVLNNKERTMNAKKYFQIILSLAILMSSFATTSAAFAASACGTSYTVISGDTIRIIATKCDTTVYALRRANPGIGSGDLIYPAQSLWLPGATIYNSDASTTVIVARGDTLKMIANRFGTTIPALVSLNPDITNANVIYEGQRLIVTGPGSGVTPPPSGGSAYTVQSGDTLRIIAARFSTTVEAILKVNPGITNANLIYVGQGINLPATASSYTVQRGDTLRTIAARFGTTVSSLLTLNPKITNANVIYVGQVIRLR